MMHGISKETLGIKGVEGQRGIQAHEQNIKCFWFSGLIIGSMLKWNLRQSHVLPSPREQMALVF